MMSKVIGFDFETTSAFPKTTRVVQFCAINFYPNIEVITSCLTNPTIPISVGASKVHGIWDEDVKNKRIDVNVLTEFYNDLKRECDKGDVILCGHNILGFDVPIFNRIVGLPELPLRYLDTYYTAMRLLPHAQSHKLSLLCQELGVGTEYLEKAHDAVSDVLMVKCLVDYLAGYASLQTGTGPITSAADLCDFMETPQVLRTCHFGKHKGKLWGEPDGPHDTKQYVPRAYARWMKNNFNGMSPDISLTLGKKYGL